jgi:hypothetical protein
MRFTIAAVTVAIAALISAAPALAEHVQGGPVTKGDQCWKGAPGMDGGTWGTWGGCPHPTGTAVAPHRRVHHS